MKQNIKVYVSTIIVTIIVLNLLMMPNRLLTIVVPLLVVSYLLWNDTKYSDILILFIVTFLLYDVWFRISNSIMYNYTTLKMVSTSSYDAGLRSVPQALMSVYFFVYHFFVKRKKLET